MGYIYKNIPANVSFTEIVPLNNIDTFNTITITNTGVDCTINLYLYKILDGVVKTFYILHNTFMTSDVTLVLDPSDFEFDNSLYSLRFHTTSSADIIINAQSEVYLALLKHTYESAVPSELQARFAGGTYTYNQDGETANRTGSYTPTWKEAVLKGQLDVPRASLDGRLLIVKGDFGLAASELASLISSGPNSSFPSNFVLTKAEALSLLEGKLFNKNHK